MTTLALNMIAGKGEKERIHSLLYAHKLLDVFDEIVIVDTQNDDLKFNGVKIIKHKWADEKRPFGDFARARNKALDNTKSDYVMWLDCDDIPPSVEELYEIKAVIGKQNKDFYFMPFIVDRGRTVFKRERIFKNNGARWVEAVHEHIDFSGYQSYGVIQNATIVHNSDKHPIQSIRRNLEILNNEIAIGNNSTHVRFHYAKDILLKMNIEYSANEAEKAIKYLKGIVFNHELEGNDTKASAACMVARWYGYGKQHSFISENVKQTELFARIAIALDPSSAEPEVILGDCFLHDSALDPESAIPRYLAAMEKQSQSGIAVRSLPFYFEIPCKRIVSVYSALGDFDTAFFYHSKIFHKRPNDPKLIEERKELVAKL